MTALADQRLRQERIGGGKHVGVELAEIAVIGGRGEVERSGDLRAHGDAQMRHDFAGKGVAISMEPVIPQRPRSGCATPVMGRKGASSRNER